MPEVGEKYHAIDGFFSTTLGYITRYNTVDERFISAHNAFTDKEQAEACAKYLRDNFWFIRNAIEFAQGYDWKLEAGNYYVLYAPQERKWKCFGSIYSKNQFIVYMTEDQSEKFAEWLNEYAPKGYLEK